MRLKGRRPADQDGQQEPVEPRLVTTVSTVRDSLPNVSRFVEQNLSAGVDHMFVFLDGEQPEVREYLQARPEVTAVTTEDSYWRRRMPSNLNVRQIVNANLVNSLLAPFDWVAWLFHIDGDEVVQVDRDQLLALPDEQRAVRLQPLEAVSRWHWDGEVDLFKRPLDKPTLCLLHQLGVIEEPDNRAYYRGHVIGKCGLRPDNELDMRIHDAWNSALEPVSFIRAPWLQLLHYETYSGEEFVRKWATAPSMKSRVSTRARREQQTAAARALFSLHGLDPAVRDRFARELYDRSFRDDVETLLELGLLERRAADSDCYVPQPLAPDRREQLETWLAELLTLDKRYLRPRSDEFPKLTGLARLVDRLAGGDGALAELVRASTTAPDGPVESGPGG
jgi:hypothetical protein